MGMVPRYIFTCLALRILIQNKLSNCLNGTPIRIQNSALKTNKTNNSIIDGNLISYVLERQKCSYR